MQLHEIRDGNVFSCKFALHVISPGIKRIQWLLTIIRLHEKVMLRALRCFATGQNFKMMAVVSCTFNGHFSAYSKNTRIINTFILFMCIILVTLLVLANYFYDSAYSSVQNREREM
jgi:hypothetical protein